MPTQSVTESNPPEEGGQTPPEATSGPRRMSLTKEAVEEVLTRLLAAGRITTGESATLTRFHAWGFELDLSMNELAMRLRKSGSTFSRIYAGKYPAALANICAEIEAFLRLEEARAKIAAPPFIETSLALRLRGVCESAREFGIIQQVYGDGQIGKTTTFKSMAAEDPRVRYLRLPKGCPPPLFDARLAEVSGASGKSVALRRAAIFASFSPQHMLIIDELQQVCLSKFERQRLAVLETLKELFDETGAAIILCGTSDAQAEMERGVNKDWLRQIHRRGFPPVILESAPLFSDVMLFATHYGFPKSVPDPVVAVIDAMSREKGLGVIINTLRATLREAVKNGTDKPTWELFRGVVLGFQTTGQAMKGGASK